MYYIRFYILVNKLKKVDDFFIFYLDFSKINAILLISKENLNNEVKKKQNRRQV